jgi:hypothetical protein
MKTKTLFASLLLFLLTRLPVALAAPGYKSLDKKPLPGFSGVHYDQPNNAIHTYYGDHDLREHMEHLMYNQRKHPENDRAFQRGKPGNTANRDKATKGIPILPGLSRDEKPPNTVIHDGTKVTVRHLPKIESGKHLFVWQFYLL